ncbi:LysR family transcriptional regulator [Pseudohalocynthiibacter aestuariivivens]|uniref:LysR family transcriptional regulator n=1 Tax=Roseovarius pelagicus TaxID=2980108 RepID=A0ABY6D821_9RHOB|nr:MULTISPECIES: LysR family transcriptional regulator [Rhodobacterales]QIE46274.1 LysR family transcriptional regulator [Pseudohalocynthiibacter aestuariivivens]UXX81750.1 LysR family transcriptional regulator [Roseovarius pelagicus]
MLSALTNPDLHLLRVFLAVVDAGGFSRAQLALNVSQSTISTQMNNLETRLRLRLCRRGRAGFALTEDGHQVYRLAKELLQDCDRFVSHVSELGGEITGELRIATADSLLGHAVFQLDKVITAARDQLPAVTLQLNVMNPLEIERLVLEQKIHLGIHTFPNHAPGLRYLPLFNETQVLCCGRQHPLYSPKTPPTPQEIDRFDYAARSYYGGMLKPGSMKPAIDAIKSGSMEGITAAILSGRFIGHLPEHCAQQWIERGEMKAVLPEKTNYDALFECVLPAGSRSSRAQAVMEDIITSFARPDAIEI